MHLNMLKHRVTQTKSNPNMCANKCEYFFDTETNALFFRLKLKKINIKEVINTCLGCKMYWVGPPCTCLEFLKVIILYHALKY